MEKKLVILGGGFAGVEAVREAEKIGLTRKMEVLLIDRSDKFEYLPALPELLSGKVGEKDVTGNLDEYAQRHEVSFLKGEVKEIDLASRIIVTDRREVDFSHLIICLGAEPNFYGIKGVENVIPAYRLSDYLEIKKELDRVCQRRGPLVIVAGAGTTGVEIAGEIADYFEEHGVDGEVTMVEKMTSALPLLNSPRASRLAMEHLERRGVKFIFSRGVVEVKGKETVLEDGTSISHDLVIWTAGIKPSRVVERLKVPNVRGWIKVDPYMRVEGLRDVYAVGDVNYVEINGEIAMEMAEEAINQARVAVKNIYRNVAGGKPIKHKVSISMDSPKCLISLGRNMAILVYGRKIAVRGRIPYLIRKKVVERRFMKRFRA